MLTDFKSRFIEMFSACNKAPLTELADITMGQSPDSSAYNDQGIGVPFYQGKTEFTDTFVTVNKYCSKPKKMAKEMDILMSVRAPVGAVNLTSQACCIGRGLAAITPKKDRTDVLFLFNALKTMEQQISDMGVGSTFTAISKDDLMKIKIPVAPVSLQNQFSSFVKQVDKSKVIKESVKSRFIEMFGNLDINDKQWKMSTIGESAKVPLHYGSTASAVDYDSETRYVRITDIGSDGKLNDDFKSPSTYDSSYLLNKGDILFARSGSVGVTYLFDEDYKSIFAGYLIRFIPDDEKLDPEFTYQFTRSSYCQGILVGSKRGGVQKNVNAKQLSAIPIPLPPMDLQKEFVDFVHQVDKSKVGAPSTILLINIYINTEA
ncbi:restriction endonuclease subunit S [Methanomethylophilus alvi]|uniref:restriction endonuclease subunit S n=1 Tax=Methanomethylophilus alvi TaxID=1291540 RepID=UPI0037DC1709